MYGLIYGFDALLTALYGVLFLFYVALFMSSHGQFKRLAAVALPSVLCLHLIKLIVQGVYAGHCPIFAFHETFSFTAFALGAIYLVIERRHKYCSTGVVFVGMALVFEAIALIADRSAAATSVPFFAGIHAPLALLGIAALVASALYGVIYLTTFRLLKSKRFGTSLNNMPSLEAIERMQSVSTLVGVVLFGIAMIAGFAIALISGQQFTLYDPKIIVAVAILAIYGYLAVGARMHSFSGKRKSAIAIVGLLFALISMTVVRLWAPTFHRF